MIFMGFLLTIMPKTGICQQEPQWLLPIYFETGDGQKDTVYIGYDPSASIYQHTVDPQFYDYEHFVYPDLTKFNAYVERSLSFGDGNNLMKGTIKSQLESHIYINFIGTGTSPITMKWDNDKLYSSGLPSYFIEIENRPRARIDIYPEVGASCYPGCLDDCYYICIDSIYPELTSYMTWDCNGAFSDSLFVNCDIVQNVDQVLSLAIAIRKFDEYSPWWSNVKNNTNSISMNIYPNPTDDVIYVEFSDCSSTHFIEVYDIFGKKLSIPHIEMDGVDRLELGKLNKGIYFIRIVNEKNTYLERVVLH